jgi:hypothetical protein
MASVVVIAAKHNWGHNHVGCTIGSTGMKTVFPSSTKTHELHVRNK